ncbi:hypothetical protein PO903_19690 [Paenibacillus sp. PK4536]|uniref:hypothetical protein n=1 Tax=Paenibacillus TaxID=44249 RepID=UPI0010C09A8B|nr:MULTISPECIES: hypothetical protein [Paenibacillus]TKJ94084.1 hypothetical protein PaeCFBP13512_00845 [Paenibacillus sp. CFBP13512]WIM38850.1 hypothetical protein PO903_19690 [Paenibacillus sp. PK4536]CAJ1314465.1 Phage protein [Paenibacillus nuruki]
MYSSRTSDALHIMTYTLNSGIKGTVPLSNQQIEEWLESYRSNTRYVTNIGKEFFGLNPELVADFKVQNQFSDHQRVIVPIQPEEQQHPAEDLSTAYKANEILIKVDCKCGTAYTTDSPFMRTKWYCTKCKEIVFLDPKKGKVETSRGEAFYMTNKYFVERAPIE